MGRVRDLLSAVPGRPVTAVGDGVAVFDPVTSAWQTQLGQDLSGLEGLYLAEEGPGWSVGQRGRIARLDQATGCWSADRPETQLNGQIDLQALMTDDSGQAGWAVGRRADGGQLLWMQTVDGLATWRDASAWVPDLPPLTDIQLLRRDPDGSEQAWLVSATAGQVLVAGLGGPATVSVDRRAEVLDRSGSRGRPREVAMRAGASDEGWLFGPSGGPSQTLTGWRYVAPDGWQPDYSLPDRGLVDLYFDGQSDGGSWWLGLAPNDRSSAVVETTDRADGQGTWSSVDGRGPPAAPGESAGSRAIASLGSGDVLYAWGDDVWRYGASDQGWTRVRRRRDLVAVADRSQGTAWLVSHDPPSTGAGLPSGAGANAAGSSILALVRGALEELPVQDGGAPVEWLPPLHALANGASGAWAAGDDGALYARPQGGAWQAVVAPRPDAGFDVVDLAVAEDGLVWAAGAADDGRGVLVRAGPEASEWSVMASAPAPLRAVAALPGGEAWAVGEGVACACSAGSCQCTTDLPFARRAGEATSLSLEAVDAVSTPGGVAVWAAGSYYVVPMAAEGWAATTRAYRLDGVPEGASLVDLAMGAPDDIWALATCRPYVQDGRGVGIVTRFDGTRHVQGEVMPASEALAMGVPLEDLSLAAASGRRTLWVAGDWSTVLRFDYRGGPAPPPAAPPSPDLRCVAAGLSDLP
jgi:hypothetical protein